MSRYSELINVCERGDIIRFRALIRACPSLICYTEAGGVSLLHIVADRGPIEMVTELLDRGIPVNFRDKYGNTPLVYAVSKNRASMVRVLIDHGANISLCISDRDNNGGNTLLHDACYHCYLEIVTILLAHGADFLVKNNNGYTPKECISNGQNKDEVYKLLQAYEDAVIDVKEPDSY